MYNNDQWIVKFKRWLSNRFWNFVYFEPILIFSIIVRPALFPPNTAAHQHNGIYSRVYRWSCSNDRHSWLYTLIIQWFVVSWLRVSFETLRTTPAASYHCRFPWRDWWRDYAVRKSLYCSSVITRTSQLQVVWSAPRAIVWSEGEKWKKKNDTMRRTRNNIARSNIIIIILLYPSWYPSENKRTNDFFATEPSGDR